MKNKDKEKEENKWVTRYRQELAELLVSCAGRGT
jgi:hypothetical protein